METTLRPPATPHEYHRSFDNWEVYTCPAEGEGERPYDFYYYYNEKGEVAVCEKYWLLEGNVRQIASQKIYDEEDENKPNWKVYEDGELFETGRVEYDAQGNIADGYYKFSDLKDGSIIERTYRGCMMDGPAIYKNPHQGVTQHVTYEKNVLQGLVTEIDDKKGIKSFWMMQDNLNIGSVVEVFEDRSGRYFSVKEGCGEGLAHNFNQNGWVESYGVMIKGEVVSIFDSKKIEIFFDINTYDLSTPVPDVATLYREALDEMERQGVDPETIMDVYDSMRRFMPSNA